MIEAVGEEGMRRIVASLVAAAQSGDVAAAKVVLSYAVGKPAAAPDPDSLDLHEQQLAGSLRDLEDQETLYHALLGVLRSSDC